MFDIESAELVNFRSYVGKHFFSFPTANGLYSVTGNNLVNPRLEANGVGKSTLLDAIFWCFYGHTTRGLRSGDVISYGQKHCSVTVNITIGTVKTIIKRTQSPNSLTLEQDGKGRPVEQDAVTKALRLSPEAFLHSVMLSQFGDSFLNLTPTNKLALFSQIMDLDYWLEKSRDADLVAKDVLESIHENDRKISHLNGQIEATKSDLQNLKVKEGAFSKTQASVIADAERYLNEHKKGSAKLITEVVDIKKVLKGTEKRSALFTQQIKACEIAIAETRHTRDLLMPKISMATTWLETARGTLENLSSVGSSCPTCHQKVDATHLKKERAVLQKVVDSVESQLQTLQKEWEAEGQRLNAQKGHLEGHQRNAQAVLTNLNDFTRELVKTEAADNNSAAKTEELTNQVKREKAQANPYTQIITEKQRLLKDSTTQSTTLGRKKGVLQKEHASVSFWVSGFKRVRLFLIEESLQQLEIEVNNNLASLGLQDWRITFDVERENKSGGVTKGFMVFVRSPDHDQPIKLEAWSGGETQRLRLAGDLGLANLIMERAGLRNTIEFFDEPSAHMTQGGLLDLAETLAQRAETEGKRIFLVDHHAIDFGGFQGVITITKDEKGSHLTYP